MPEEKKEETTTLEETTEETVDETTEEEASTEETTEESSEDWKKIAEDERLKKEKAEKKLAGKRYHKKDTKEEVDDEDKPLSASELRAILAEDRQENQKEFLSSRVKEIAKSLSDSDEEASAVTAIHSNRNFPASMTLDEQVKEAYFIAHGPRLLAKRDELRRSLKGKDSVNKTGADNIHRDQAKPEEPKISPQDKAELGRLGFKWDGKFYSKKLSNGKTLVKDWNTKKVFIK